MSVWQFPFFENVLFLLEIEQTDKFGRPVPIAASIEDTAAIKMILKQVSLDQASQSATPCRPTSGLIDR